MKIKPVTVTTAFLILMFTISHSGQTAEKIIKLPKPDTKGGMALMSAISKRHSSRSYSDRAITAQVLSNLLWAANGVSRSDGKRTAPSARDMQEIDVYAAMKGRALPVQREKPPA